MFALWIARPGVDLRGFDAALAAARDRGLKRLAEIARHEAPNVGIPEEDCLSYLRDHLEFRLGPRQRRGWNVSMRWPRERTRAGGRKTCVLSEWRRL